MSHYKAYPAYKDSGIEWLGAVPEGWDVKKIKHSFQIVGGATPKSDQSEFWDGDVVWVTPSDLSKLSSLFISNSQRKISSAGLASCAASLVPAQTIILSTRAPIGSLAIAESELCTNQGCKSLIPVPNVEAKFYAYLLSVSSTELNIRGKGTTFLELSGDELGSFPIPSPSTDEQCVIVAHLDRETARIDGLVGKKTRFIELLREKRQALITHAVTKGLAPDVKMKDSGVEWLGEVPEHWTVCKLSYRYSVELGKMLDEKRITGKSLVSYLRNQDVQWDAINIDDLPEMDIYIGEIERYTISCGDLLVCEGGDVGRAAIWRGDNQQIGFQKALHRLRPRLSEDDTAEFFYFSLLTAKKRGVFEESDAGATFSHLPAEKFRQYRFAFPPLAEQVNIATQIRERSSRLDTLISKTESSIALLKERRSALITAAVTGQIDLRDARAAPVVAPQYARA